jgi:hypothetical protein
MAYIWYGCVTLWQRRGSGWGVGKLETRKQKGRKERKGEERFLSAQADPFAGAKGEEKVGLLRSK